MVVTTPVSLQVIIISEFLKFNVYFILFNEYLHSIKVKFCLILLSKRANGEENGCEIMIDFSATLGNSIDLAGRNLGISVLL